MKEEKRILNALGQVEDKYIAAAAPPPRRRCRPWLKWAAAAAGLALIIAAAARLAQQPLPPPDPPVEAVQPQPPVEPQPEAPVLKLSGGQVGTLHLLQANYVEATDRPLMPDFLIYVNQETYQVQELPQEASYTIMPQLLAPELPLCSMEITWQPQISVEEAALAQAQALSATLAQVEAAREAYIIDGLLVRASNGAAWDDEQVDVYVTGDQNGGVFLFKLSYFTEAAEGHGLRFTDMLRTFELAPLAATAPEWLTGLREVTMRFIPAFFSNDFSSVADILAPGAAVGSYEEDVYAQVSLAGIDTSVDNDQSPTQATVSVRHRLDLEDSFNYVTIELSYEQGAWQVVWAGIEK